MKRQWLFAAALLAFSASSMAVDGYKNLKFGMSEKDALSTKTCSFKKTPSGQKGLDFFSCENFKFGGKDASAGIFFIDGKLARFGFEQPVDDAIAFIETMKEKYGEPINPPSMSSLQALQRVPNSTVDVNFDNNTVSIRFISDADLNQGMLVMYSIPDYNQKLIALKNAQISSDL